MLHDTGVTFVSSAWGTAQFQCPRQDLPGAPACNCSRCVRVVRCERACVGSNCPVVTSAQARWSNAHEVVEAKYSVVERHTSKDSAMRITRSHLKRPSNPSAPCGAVVPSLGRRIAHGSVLRGLPSPAIGSRSEHEQPPSRKRVARVKESAAPILKLMPADSTPAAPS